jgi:hypothetical protein
LLVINSCILESLISPKRCIALLSEVNPRIQGGWLDNPAQQIKDKIKGEIAEFARRIPGYELLALILGKDPVSGKPVERNATNLIRGLLSFVPNGSNIFNNLQQSGALQRAFNWFNQEVTKLNLSWDAIKGLFAKAINPFDGFEKIKNVFTQPIARIKKFAVAASTKVMEFAFEGFLNMAGGAGAKVMSIIRSAGRAIANIFKNPVRFAGNLVAGVKGGFQKFASNMPKHLENGVADWLFGAMAGAGLALPAKFDLKGIVSLVVQVLGLTYEKLRGKLVKILGEPRVKQLEQAFDFLKTIVTGGLAAAWQKISEFAGNLEEMVIGGIGSWVQNTIITAAITKLISMFNPAGAIAQAVMAIYNTFMFFIERRQEIAALSEAVFASIGNIAAGNVAGAANSVEQAMGRSLSVMISFLARLIGLGGISKQIKNVIKRIQAPIDGAINKLANFIVEKAKGLLGRSQEDKIKALGFSKDKLQIGEGDGKPEHYATKNELTNEAKNNNLAAAEKELRKIISKSENTKEVERRFPALKQKFGLKKIEWNQLGTSSASIIIEINPRATIDLSTFPLVLNSGDTSHSNLLGFTQNITFEASTIAGFPVGKKMEATRLGPNHPQGTPPTNSSLGTIMKSLPTDPNLSGDNKYIKGHLLNDNLGGPGEDRNLYPITAIANKQHEAYVEYYVKQWVNKNGYWVYYKVEVNQQYVNLSEGKVTADLICEANKLDVDGKKTSLDAIKKTIHSELNIKKSVTVDSANFDSDSGDPIPDRGFDKDKVEWSTAKGDKTLPQKLDDKITRAVLAINNLWDDKNFSKDKRESEIKKLYDETLKTQIEWTVKNLNKKKMPSENLVLNILSDPTYTFGQYSGDNQNKLSSWNEAVQTLNKDTIGISLKLEELRKILIYKWVRELHRLDRNQPRHPYRKSHFPNPGKSWQPFQRIRRY